MTDTTNFKEKYPNLWSFFNNTTGSLTFSAFFSYAYVILLIITVLTSLAAPIDKGITYFRFVATVFSFLTVMSLIGVATFMAENGLYPE